MGRGKRTGRGGRTRRQPGLRGIVRAYEGRVEVETAEGTYRVPGRGLAGAMPDDRVYVSLVSSRGRRRAVVEQVLERAAVSVVGTFAPAGPLGAVQPLDRRIKQDFFVLPEDDSPARIGVCEGDIVVARIVEYPTRAEAGVVTIERVLGDSSSPSLGIECIMARHGLAQGYPTEAVHEADACTVDVAAALADPLRRDVRDRFAFTIDPTDARDFDDALSVCRVDDGGWRLSVHIADVSAYVPWASSLDLEARRRSCSVYLADRVLPMLPERLSCDVCSLRPCEDRLAFTVEMHLDARGAVEAYEAYPSVMRSRLRLDYAAADALLAGVEVPDVPAQVDGVDVRAMLREASTLAQVRRELRARRGSIDFDTQEVHAVLDEDGTPTAIAVRERTEATSLVEEAMLLANECVAEFLSDRDLVAAYRVHEAPSLDGLASAAKTLVEAGAMEPDIAPGVMLGEPRAIARALAEASDPYKPLVNALLLRAQQRAEYKPHNEGHYALGARAYCHFTSPIRRYPDLMVHRALKFALARRELGKKAAVARASELVGTGPESAEALCAQLCRHASEAERVADAAARASQKVKVAQYYAGRIGERATGTVSWVSDMGVFVRLDDTAAEGLIRPSTLGDEWWEFDEMRLRYVGSRSGRVVGVGQRIEVEVARVDVMRGHLDFTPCVLGAALH